MKIRDIIKELSKHDPESDFCVRNDGMKENFEIVSRNGELSIRTGDTHIEYVDSEPPELDSELKDMIPEISASVLKQVNDRIQRRNQLRDSSPSDFKINEILDAIKELGAIDREDVVYRSEEFNFSKEEFDDFFEYLEIINNPSYTSKYSSFPEERKYFEYNGFKFIWRMIVGQGTACQLLKIRKSSEIWPKEWPMVFLEENKFILK